MRPREAKPFTRRFPLCECGESVIIVRFIADPMTFLRAIPCQTVVSTKADASCAGRIFLSRRNISEGGCSMKITEWSRRESSDMDPVQRARAREQTSQHNRANGARLGRQSTGLPGGRALREINARQDVRRYAQEKGLSEETAVSKGSKEG